MAVPTTPRLLTPRLIFGSMARRDQPEAARIDILQAAVECGMTTIDTAPLYGYGSAERYIAKALSGHLSAKVQILTKVGLRWDDEAQGEVLYEFEDQQGQRRTVRKDSRPESIVWEVDRSLQRLDLDCVELVQIHQPDIHTPINETMSALLDLQQAGKLKHIGVSNFSPAQVQAAELALGEHKLASIQQDYSLLERSVEADLLPLCLAREIALFAYSPLAGGALALPAQPSSTRFLRRLLTAGVAPIAARHGVQPAVVALAWVISQAGVNAAIVGASSVAQVEQLAAAAELGLTDDELAQLAVYSRLSPVNLLTRRTRRLGAKVKRLVGRVAPRAKPQAG